MKKDVITLQAEPLCAETPLGLQEDLITPASRFYARNDFPFPGDWPGLTIDGAVERPRALTLADLHRFPSRNLIATMECAGNGRAFLNPAVPGEQWQLGAVSTADWSGVSLRDLLIPAGVRVDTVEVQFQASDGFARSLPIDVALAPETMLVLDMNGRALPAEHGGPVRVLVPGWYGMSAVKWVTRIVALTEPFRGHYQVERYVIEDRPVREMAVRAVITKPGPDESVAANFTAQGFAWTGRGIVSSVEVSTDGGKSWTAATMVDSPTRFAWIRWTSDISAKAGETLQVVCRATDSTGRVQPLAQIWNALGYCNNASRQVAVTVRLP